MSRKRTAEEMQKVLGEPIFIEFPENVRKIRNNLLVLSLIGIFVVMGGVSIDPNSNFFGMHFTGLTNQLIFVGLFFVNLYMLIHFVWYGWDCFLEWRVRSTGTRTYYITAAKFADDAADYPADPRQSTLYNWWKDEARKIGSFTEFAEQIKTSFEEWKSKIQSALDGKDPNVGVYINQIHPIGQTVDGFSAAIRTAMTTLDHPRIPTSLERFDQTYKRLLKSQNLRWLLIELGLPAVLGLIAVLLLLDAIL